LHAVKVQLLVRALVSRFSSAFPNRIELKENIADSFRLFCDPDLFDQALCNLLDNALKYSPPNGPIQVIVDETGFEVRDQGPGLSSVVERRIGEPFNFGEENRNSTKDSFGLGLAWVNAIATAYGWKLSFKREEKYFSAKITWAAEERKIP
jgi:signal transduction histidine kinase